MILVYCSEQVKRRPTNQKETIYIDEYDTTQGVDNMPRNKFKV